jgi:hypothetical protein
MSKMIQIRNVPDDLHREVKARASRAGMSLSDFLLREVERIVDSPPLEEILSRWAARERPSLSETPAEVIRQERDSR